MEEVEQEEQEMFISAHAMGQRLAVPTQTNVIHTMKKIVRYIKIVATSKYAISVLYRAIACY